MQASATASGIIYVPFPIASTATNLAYGFYGQRTHTILSITGGVSIQASGAFARYIKQTNDFTVPDEYQWQFSYDLPGPAHWSSDAPHPILRVGQRLINL